MALRPLKAVVGLLWSIIKLVLFLAIMAKVISYVMGGDGQEEQDVPIE